MISVGRHFRPTTPALIAFALVALAMLAGAAGCRDSTAPEGRPSLAVDPANDFITSYTGPKNGDLDAREAETTLTGQSLVFRGTVGGSIGTTAGAVYVWGVDWGAGTARFGDIATGVHFDAVVIAFPDGTGSMRDFTTGTAQPLAPGSVVVMGTTINVTVPAALLPSKGFSPEHYTVNFWPRSGLASNAQIADFAPDNANMPVRVGT